MSGSISAKLLPRNVAALRRGQTPEAATRVTAGNPISTRLESGVGNCFPGLEFDMRNLERRFDAAGANEEASPHAPRLPRSSAPLSATDNAPLFKLRKVAIIGAITLAPDRMVDAYQAFLGKEVSQADLAKMTPVRSMSQKSIE